MHFNGEARHEWPEFATSFLELGRDEGGWEQALEMQLDLQVATNKRLNKMAWCYLTLMLEGSALDEMDMVPDKNAYEVWQHLKETFEPKGSKSNDYQEIKFVKCKLESSKKVNDFLEKEVMDEDANGDEDEEACATFGSSSGDGAQSEQSYKGKGQFSFQCHQEEDQHQQHGMEKMIVETSDEMVVPNEIMEQGKQQIIMKESVSENPKLQSEEKQIEQQEGRHGQQRHKEDNTNGIDLWKEYIEADKWEVDGRKKEHHKPVVKDEEENPTREEDQEGHEELSVEPKEFNAEPSGDGNPHVQEDHQEFTVEPREHEHMDIKDGFKTFKVERKVKGGEKDAKDGKECLFGEEEVRNHDVKGGEKFLIGDPEFWMEDENIFAVYLFHEETRHSMEERKGRKSQGAREEKPMSGELEIHHVPKIVREAVSRFKQKANE